MMKYVIGSYPDILNFSIIPPDLLLFVFKGDDHNRKKCTNMLYTLDVRYDSAKR